MARFGVRSRAVAFATWAEDPKDKPFERTGALGREGSLALAMQKVMGSSPIIRSLSSSQSQSQFDGPGRCRFCRSAELGL